MESKMQYEELGVGFAFRCGKVDGRAKKEYVANNYYYAGAYDQGFQLGRLEIKLLQDAIDTLNIEWSEAHKHESWMLANEIGAIIELYIMKLQKLQKGK
jgi:hypothetical protein